MVEKRFDNLLRQIEKMTEDNEIEKLESLNEAIMVSLFRIREQQYQVIMEDCNALWETWEKAGFTEPVTLKTGVSHFSESNMEEEYTINLKKEISFEGEIFTVNLIIGEKSTEIFDYEDFPSELLDDWAEIAEHLEDELEQQILKIYDEKCKAAFPRHKELMAALDAARAGLEKSLSRKNISRVI